jgi:hypothetical protein
MEDEIHLLGLRSISAMMASMVSMASSETRLPMARWASVALASYGALGLVGLGLEFLIQQSVELAELGGCGGWGGLRCGLFSRVWHNIYMVAWFARSGCRGLLGFRGGGQ